MCVVVLSWLMSQQVIEQSEGCLQPCWRECVARGPMVLHHDRERDSSRFAKHTDVCACAIAKE